ncbi:MFS transporter [Flavobacteriaceae bacterium Ap0902]|nr:MFS transporter [Flavobacteriaceae bacterium Ap0902]
MPTLDKKKPIELFVIPEFRNLMSGRFMLIMGLRMMGALVGWWIYQLTGDPFSIGLIGLAEVIPAVSCALFAGHVIDNTEKKTLLLICVYGYLLVAGFLFYLAWAEDHGFTKKQVTYAIYGAIFLTGITRSFIGPIVPSMIPRVVSMTNLPPAITINQATFLGASVAGHAISGFLIAWFEIEGALLFIMALIFAGSMFFWFINAHPSEVEKGKVNMFQSIKEGIVYIKNTRELIGAMTLDLFAVLFGGAVAMVPVYATDILDAGAQGFGILNAGTDIGAILVISLLTFFPLNKNQGKIMIGCVAGFGACIIIFGLSTFFWLSFFALMLSGVLDGISMVIRGTIIQLKTPDHLRGRVMSVNTIFVSSSNELGQFESGLASRLLGVVPSVVFGGTMTLLTATTVWFKFPKLRKMTYK